MTLTNDTITNKYRSLKYIYQYKNVFFLSQMSNPKLV